MINLFYRRYKFRYYKRLDTDENGPFVLGEILTKKISEEKSSTLVAYSNGLFATNYQVNFSGTVTIPLALRNNKDIVLNTIAYLSNREDTIRIRKKYRSSSIYSNREAK